MGLGLCRTLDLDGEGGELKGALGQGSPPSPAQRPSCCCPCAHPQTERDVSVRQRAVDLLYAMCDRSNAQQIVAEMLSYLETADYSIREEIVSPAASVFRASALASEPRCFFTGSATGWMSACASLSFFTGVFSRAPGFWSHSAEALILTLPPPLQRPRMQGA